MENKVYQMVVDKVIDRIEGGNFKDWRSLFSSISYRPINYQTGRPYNWINSLILSWECSNEKKVPEFITFNAIKKLSKEIPDKGIHLKKGSKSLVVFSHYLWDMQKKQKQFDSSVLSATEDDDEGDKNKRFRWCFGYTPVFSVSDVEGLTPKKDYKMHKNDESVISSDEVCDKLIKDYLTHEGIRLTRKNAGNYYSPSVDEINIVDDRDFESTDFYYGTVFHEMVHSTGNKKRLDRNLIGMSRGSYGKEELIAELGSAFLMAEFKKDLTDDSEDETAFYLDNWLKAIKEDPKMLVMSSIASEKAVNYIKKSAGITD